MAVQTVAEFMQKLRGMSPETRIDYMEIDADYDFTQAILREKGLTPERACAFIDQFVRESDLSVDDHRLMCVLVRMLVSALEGATPLNVVKAVADHIGYENDKYENLVFETLSWMANGFGAKRWNTVTSRRFTSFVRMVDIVIDEMTKYVLAKAMSAGTISDAA